VGAQELHTHTLSTEAPRRENDAHLARTCRNFLWMILIRIEVTVGLVRRDKRNDGWPDYSGWQRHMWAMCSSAGHWTMEEAGSGVSKSIETSSRRSVPCKSESEYCPNCPQAETLGASPRRDASRFPRLHVEAFLIAIFPALLRYDKAISCKLLFYSSFHAYSQIFIPF
jgi:hypothetical protein